MDMSFWPHTKLFMHISLTVYLALPLRHIFWQCQQSVTLPLLAPQESLQEAAVVLKEALKRQHQVNDFLCVLSYMCMFFFLVSRAENF